MNTTRLNKAVILLMLLFISGIFVSMIRNFLLAILLAGIFAGLLQPVFKKLVGWCRGNRSLASGLTLLLLFLVIFLPLAGLLGIVIAQAVRVGRSVSPWIQEKIHQPSAFDELLRNLPFYDTIRDYNQVILEKAGQLVSGLSTVLVNGLSTATLSTFHSIFLFFMFLYTMYFFLKDGNRFLEKILFYLPLKQEDEVRLLEKFTSVTRATIKGTLVIGLMQGSLAGLAFWAVGIDSAIFWGAIMVVLATIPMVGTALVWVPAVIILAASGYFVKAIVLAVFCSLIVGSLDNFLRPILVGKDTRMHTLFILFGTLGGISMFGIVGFIIGPIIAALFVAVWEIYGETFKDYLPVVLKPKAVVEQPPESQSSEVQAPEN